MIPFGVYIDGFLGQGDTVSDIETRPLYQCFNQTNIVLEVTCVRYRAAQ
jgi:hypothetical protein